jgi:hypothetical protein
MSAQPAYQNKQEEWAFYRRRDHANIEALQNLVISEIAARARAKFMRENPDVDLLPSYEMPTNVRHLISALQGAHGGGKQPFEEFARDYLTIGKQLQFTGAETAIRARVRNWIDDLDEWQYLVGVQLFPIRKGGKVIGQHPDGTPIRETTTFIDYLKPHADDGVSRARLSDQWKGDAAQGIKAHPGLALEAQVDSVIQNLPVLGTRAEAGAEKAPPSKQTVTEYSTKQEERICDSAEKVADEIEARGGDSDLWLEKLELALLNRRRSRFKTKPARHDTAALAAVQEISAARNVTTYTCNSEEGETDAPIVPEVEKSESVEVQPEVENALCNSDVTQGFIEVCEDSASQEWPSMLQAALFWVSAGFSIIPLHTLKGGGCTCKKGAKCRTPGKHPRWHAADLPEGSINATKDPEQIKVWWQRWPDANIGAAMGGDARLLGFDVDPRNGGDVSFYDLCQAHGDEWRKTMRTLTGSRGFHLFFVVPHGVEFKKDELAPGIDLKWNNGLMVLPPSSHASGKLYEVVDLIPVAIAPQWLLDELVRPTDEQPKVVVDFQERKDRAGMSKEKILDGQRNKALFRVLIGRWRHGWAADEAELLSQAMEINQVRCVTPLEADEVCLMASHIASDYAHERSVDKEGAA